MDRFKKFLIATLAVAGLFTLPASAQTFPSVTDRMLAGETASIALGDDLDKALVCVYVGTSGSGYVSVSAAGDLLFESPDASTANTHIECDASIAADGSRNGTIDVSVAACDTLTEIVNIVNKPESDFRCAILSALGSDLGGSAGGTGYLLAATDQNADGPNGYTVKWDTSAKFDVTFMVAPLEFYNADKWFSVAPGATAGRANPFQGLRGYVRSAYSLSTYGSGTSTTDVVSVAGNYLPYTAAAGTTGTPRRTGLTYSETATTLWSATNGATTVGITIGHCATYASAATTPGCDPAWGEFIQGRKNEKLLVRLNNSAAAASTAFNVNGYLYSWQ